MNKMLGNKFAIAIFTLPALIFYTVLVFYSTIQVAIGSLFEYDFLGISRGTFVGLKKFEYMFNQDIFYASLKNGYIVAAIMIFIQIGLGMFFALVLSDKEIRFSKFFRITIFLPVVISVSAACILAIAVLTTDGGLLNTVFHIIGINYSQSWLTKPDTAIYAIAVVTAWQHLGFFLTVFYAGIKSIPSQYYEAAYIDGASKPKIYIKVIIPLLSDVIKFCLLFSVLGGLNMFAQSLILTGGGPGSSSYTLTLLLYNRGLGTNNYGYGSAIAVFIICQALFVNFIINKFVAKEKISY